MPTYEYKCNNCGHKFEKFHSITSPAIRKCPECGKNAVERLISAGGGLIFKGSGFYITDYRSDNYKAGAKKDAPATASSGGDSKSSSSETKSTPAKSESKPAKPAKGSS